MTRKRQKTVTKRQIQKILMESVFTPSERTPISVVVGMNDPRYCQLKVIELMHEINFITSFPTEREGEYNEKISQAITLLAVARAQRENMAVATVFENNAQITKNKATDEAKPKLVQIPCGQCNECIGGSPGKCCHIRKVEEGGNESIQPERQ